MLRSGAYAHGRLAKDALGCLLISESGCLEIRTIRNEIANCDDHLE